MMVVAGMTRPPATGARCVRREWEIGMAKYLVYVRRSESITFEVEATDEGDALARYLMDGDEIASKTVATEVDGVALIESEG